MVNLAIHLANQSASVNISLVLVLALIWSLIWKGFALWKSARKKHIVWFIVILIINTIGILPILYLFIFSKKSPKSGDKKEREKQDKNKSK